MSERKVLNKYYPPDFDPSKIPRARCPRNRQFTVRLMVPCNVKCYTCGEYIAKGKKFNARKEDVENMTYLGVRIYRFYIKCPGCLAEISFRTDPESTDYVIEAGAHRNFQALKLAEEQAAREEREAKEEIESNPMLLLENRTQQSQYEMEVLESLEDLRDMNERHAGIDLGKMTEKYETERKLSQEQMEEAEHLEAMKALGYQMIEGQMVKRIAPEQLSDASLSKKPKSEAVKPRKNVQTKLPADKLGLHSKNSTIRSKMSGLIRAKGKQPLQCSGSRDGGEQNSDCSRKESTRKPQSCTQDDKSGLELPKKCESVVSNITDLPGSGLPTKSVGGAVVQTKSVSCGSSESEQKFLGLGLLGVYSDSESGDETN